MPGEESGLPTAIYDDLAPAPQEESKPVEKAPQMSQAEIDARASGWMAKEEWVSQGHDAEEHVSPREYNRAGEFIQRIKNQNNQMASMRDDLKSRNDRMDGLEKALNELVKHNQKLTESQVRQTRDELYTSRAEALIEQDASKVAELDNALDQLKTLENTPEPKVESPGDPDPALVVDPRFDAFNAWTNRPENNWFETDAVRRGAFIALGDEVAAELGENTDLNIILDEAKKRLVKEFPKAFGGTKPPAPNSEVLEDESSSGSGRGGGSGFTVNDLSSDQLAVARTFEQNGVMSVQEYVDQLADIGGIEK